MTDAAGTGLDDHIGSIQGLLAKRGRSSTPRPPGGEKIRLADVIGLRDNSPAHPEGRLKIAAIVHDEMLDAIEQYFAVIPLMPSCLVNSVDSHKPQVIIIHRAAFHEGPWVGAEASTGGKAAKDILRLNPWSKKHDVPILFIENGTQDGFYTSAFREMSSEVFPSDRSHSRVPEGAPRSKVFQLAAQFAINKADQNGDY